MVDFPTPVASITRIRIPKSFNGRNPQSRRDLASTLRERTHGLTPPPPRTANRASGAPEHPGSDRIEQLRRQLRDHPCHRCPDREDHARWAERWFKLDRDARTLRRRIEQRTNTIARQFDRVCEVLDTLDYLDGDTVTPRGRALMRIYNEMDLVTAESLRAGLWDDLDASQLAAVLSALVFESRRADDQEPVRALPDAGPEGRVRQRGLGRTGGADQRDDQRHGEREPGQQPSQRWTQPAERAGADGVFDEEVRRRRERHRHADPYGDQT